MRKIKMLLSLVLIVALSFSMMTFNAFAEENVYENGVEVDIELLSPESYSISTSGSIKSGSVDSYIGLHTGVNCVELFRIPVPSLADNQTVNSFKFQFTTMNNTPAYGNVGGGSVHVLKFPGEKWQPEKMTLNDADVASIIKNYTSNSAYDQVVSVVAHENDNKKRINTVDITTYAKEAIENEQKYIYLGVYIINSTLIHGTAFWGSERGLYTPHYYFTPCERPAPEPVIVTNKVDGSAFSITSSANPSLFGMIFKSVKYQNNNFVLFRFDLTEIKSKIKRGLELNDFKFKTFIGSAKNVTALEFAGDEWIMYPGEGETGLKFNDTSAQKIISDWYTNRSKSTYNAADGVSYESINQGYVWGVYDVTSYAKECIANDQNYMFVGLISDSSQSCYGFSSTNKDSSKYSYSIAAKGAAPVSFSDVKIVNASDDVTDFESAVHLSQVPKETSCKAVCEFTVNSLKEESVRIIIAQYNADKELKNLVFGNPVTVSSSSANRLLVSANLAVESDSDHVKAFVWRASDIQPLCVSAESQVK